MNGVGFFGTFSARQCRRLFLVPPIFKVLQTVASQLILANRTYSISQKATWVKITMVLMFCASIPTLFFCNIYKRKPIMTPEHNCTSGNDTWSRVAWLHYVVSMLFDVVTIGIASAYLWRYTVEFKKLSYFLRRLFYEGLGYFILLTAVNIFNIVLFRSPNLDTQSSGVSIGYIVIWITSQGILIHQHETAQRRLEGIVPPHLFSTCSSPGPSAAGTTAQIDPIDFGPADAKSMTATNATQAHGDAVMGARSFTITFGLSAGGGFNDDSRSILEE